MTRQPASPDLFYIERRSVIEMLEDYDVLERAQRSVVAALEGIDATIDKGVKVDAMDCDEDCTCEGPIYALVQDEDRDFLEVNLSTQKTVWE